MEDVNFSNIVEGAILVLNGETGIIEIQYCQDKRIFNNDIDAIDAVISAMLKGDEEAMLMLKEARGHSLVFERLCLFIFIPG